MPQRCRDSLEMGEMGERTIREIFFIFLLRKFWFVNEFRAEKGNLLRITLCQCKMLTGVVLRLDKVYSKLFHSRVLYRPIWVRLYFNTGNEKERNFATLEQLQAPNKHVIEEEACTCWLKWLSSIFSNLVSRYSDWWLWKPPIQNVLSLLPVN